MCARSAAIFHFMARWKRSRATAMRDFREGRTRHRRGKPPVSIPSASRAIQIKIGDVGIHDCRRAEESCRAKHRLRESSRRAFTFRCKISPRRNLLKPGSVAHYRDYVKFPEGVDVEQRIAALVPQIQALRARVRHGRKTQKGSWEALENLYRFLNLVASSRCCSERSAWQRDSGASATKAQHGRDSALSRRVGAQRLCSFTCCKPPPWVWSGAIAGAGSRAWHATDLPARSCKRSFRSRFPTTIAWQPIVRGMSDRLRDLHPLCASVAPAVSASLAASCPALGGRWTTPRRDGAISLVWLVYVVDRGRRDRVSPFRNRETWTRGLVFAGALGFAIAIFAGSGEASDRARAEIFSARLEFRSAPGSGQSLSARTIAPFFSRSR